MDLYYRLDERSNFRVAVDINAFSQIISLAKDIDIHMQLFDLFFARYTVLDTSIMGDLDWQRLTFKKNCEITVTDYEQFMLHISVYVSLAYTNEELKRILRQREDDEVRDKVSSSLDGVDDTVLVDVFVMLSSMGSTIIALFVLRYMVKKMPDLLESMGCSANVWLVLSNIVFQLEAWPSRVERQSEVSTPELQLAVSQL